MFIFSRSIAAVIKGCLLLTLALLSACAVPLQDEDSKRFFWPPDPAYAKIEYLATYVSATDLKVTKPGFIDEFLGTDLPRPVFAYPYGVAVSQDDKLFVSDTKGNSVAIFDFALEKVSYLLDKKNSRYHFRLPLGVAVLSDGRVVVADSVEHKVFVFSPAGKYLESFGAETLKNPTGLAYSETLKQIFVVDTAEHQVVVFDDNYRKIGTIGARGSQPGMFNFPVDIAIGPAGNLFVLDALNARVQVFSPEGLFLRQFGERGTASGSFALPKSLAVSAYGHVYVTDSLLHKVVVFDTAGQHLLSFGGRSVSSEGKFSAGGFYSPVGITVDGSGAIFVVDAMNRALHRFQYLTPEYLDDHPILPGQTLFPSQLSGGVQ